MRTPTFFLGKATAFAFDVRNGSDSLSYNAIFSGGMGLFFFAGMLYIAHCRVERSPRLFNHIFQKHNRAARRAASRLCRLDHSLFNERSFVRETKLLLVVDHRRVRDRLLTT